jgi:hypothetical protein
MTIPIVVVDDDKVDRYITRRIVKEADVGGEVVEYKSGDEFLAAIGDAQRQAAEGGEPMAPMLVFLDINMPRMNGFEVLEAIKQELPETAKGDGCMVVMMFSSSNHAKDKAEALSYDFVKEYVVKPLTKERLQELVAKYYG